MYEDHLKILSVRVRVLLCFSLLPFPLFQMSYYPLFIVALLFSRTSNCAANLQSLITRDSHLRVVWSYRLICFRSSSFVFRFDITLSSPLVYRYIEVVNIPGRRWETYLCCYGVWILQVGLAWVGKKGVVTSVSTTAKCAVTWGCCDAGGEHANAFVAQ